MEYLVKLHGENELWRQYVADGKFATLTVD